MRNAQPLFIYDPAKDELWSKVAEGTEQKQIRIPAAAGIAGAAFISGDVLNIPDAYADPRFNPEIDRTSGFRTRNLLNVPVIDRTGEAPRRRQVLNKRGGPFTQVDIRRLKAFSAGIAVALENARLFSDVLALKNYNENILKSLSRRRRHARSAMRHRQGQRGGAAHPRAVGGGAGRSLGRACVRQSQRVDHPEPRVSSPGWEPPTITPTPT